MRHREAEIRYSSEYYYNNREEKIAKQVEYQNIRYKEDPQYRLAKLIRNRLRSVLKGRTKVGSAVGDIGCTGAEAFAHFESLYTEGMTREAWFRGEIHIDHIIPLSSFDLTDREQFLKACNYKNIQPLWAEDNLKKAASLDYDKNIT